MNYIKFKILHLTHCVHCKSKVLIGFVARPLQLWIQCGLNCDIEYRTRLDYIITAVQRDTGNNYSIITVFIICLEVCSTL